MGEPWDRKSGPALLEPRPAGFPHCRHCPYDTLNRVDVCLGCVGDPVLNARPARCPVCEQTLELEGDCANDWCSREDRWFSLVWSVASHVPGMRSAITRYKFRRELRWAPVFARLFVGYLDEHMPWFDDYDLLLPMPAYVGPDAERGWDHVGLIALEARRLASPRWPVVTGILEKTGETLPMTGQPLATRRATAEGRLRHVLRVTDPAFVAGAQVLVIDDVFTEGSTLREVARALLHAGAEEVAGLALIRQPWAGGRGGSRIRSGSP